MGRIFVVRKGAFMLVISVVVEVSRELFSQQGAQHGLILNSENRYIHPARNRVRGPCRHTPHFWDELCISLSPVKQENTHSKLNRGNLGQSNTFKCRIQVVAELEQ